MDINHKALLEKHCNKCGATKMKSDFHKDASKSDGLRLICKDCQNSYARELMKRPELKAKKVKWREEHRDKHAEYNSAHRKRHRRLQTLRMTAWRKSNPEKRTAHNMVYKAILSGKIERKPCEVCGKKAMAHHHDYSKPLDVQWLCHLHHAEEHKAIRSRGDGGGTIVDEGGEEK